MEEGLVCSSAGPWGSRMSLHQSIGSKKTSRHESIRQSMYKPRASQPQMEDNSPRLDTKAGNDEDIVPGKVVSIQPGDRLSPLAFKSDGGLPTRIVRGSFHRRAGIRETIDASGQYKYRTIEIKRTRDKSIGFYIRQGDGWKCKSGIFVSRVNLGSVVDVNDLMHVGEEIVKVNSVDVTRLPLNDVVSLMQKERNKLYLTIKMSTSEAITRSLLTKKAVPIVAEESEIPLVSTHDTSLDEQTSLEEKQDTSTSKYPQDTHEPMTSTSTTSMQLSSISISIADSSDGLSMTEESIRESSTQSFSPLGSSTPIEAGRSPEDSPVSSCPPTPPTSPVPELTESPLPSPHGDHTSMHESSSRSSRSELTDSLLNLLDSSSPFNDELSSVSTHTNTVTPHPDTHSSLPLQSHPPPSLQSLTPSPPQSLPPSPLGSPPPPPLPSSPPPLLPYELPLAPDHPSIPTQSDSDDEDIFQLQNIESHLRHWLTHYEISDRNQLTEI